MSISKRLLKYLSKHKIGFKIIPHKKVYTTFDLATTLKTGLDKVSKSLLVKADKRYIIVVLPAHVRLNLLRLKSALKASKVSIASEKEMLETLKIKTGSLDPFGKFKKLEVVIDKELSKLKKVIMRSGSFTESLEVPVRDYVRIEQPIIASIGEKIKKIIVAGSKKKSKKSKVKAKK